MYSFDIPDDLTIENVLSRVSEEVLWIYYIGNFKIGVLFSAPYRIDIKPSFRIKYDRRGKLVFEDFGRPGFYGGIFDYFKLTEGKSIPETLRMINKDFGLGLGSESSTTRYAKVDRLDLTRMEARAKEIKISEKKEIFIQVEVKKFDEEDLEYWRGFGVTLKTLLFYNVYRANIVRVDGAVVYNSSYSNKRCYAYYFPKTKHFKCYFPEKETYRFWPSNISKETDIQGYWQCGIKDGNREDKLIILTKSMKDCMCLRELGYDAIALHGEAHRIPEDFLRHIKKYYKYIFTLYDKDLTGIVSARRIWRENNIPAYFINKYYESKDISDLVKNKGLKVAEDFMKGVVLKVKLLNCERS